MVLFHSLQLNKNVAPELTNFSQWWYAEIQQRIEIEIQLIDLKSLPWWTFMHDPCVLCCITAQENEGKCVLRVQDIAW